jgi:hypothetical protein
MVVEIVGLDHRRRRRCPSVHRESIPSPSTTASCVLAIAKLNSDAPDARVCAELLFVAVTVIHAVRAGAGR